MRSKIKGSVFNMINVKLLLAILMGTLSKQLDLSAGIQRKILAEEKNWGIINS